MNLTLKISAAFIMALLLFIAGVVVGNSYQITDLLCPSAATSHRLTEDLISDTGIRFPKGTLVPLRQCAYMQRFRWHFAIDHAAPLQPAGAANKQNYGFSELRPAHP